VSLLARGLVWLCAYLALMVAPMVVAIAVDPFTVARPALVEVSVALGLISFPAILAQFALVSHLRVASRPFGTDALMQVHRYMGFLALAMVVGHPLLLNVVNLPWSSWNLMSANAVARSGGIALWAIVVLVVTTVVRQRLRLSYETWRSLHLVLSVIAVAAMLVHVLAVGGYSGPVPMRAVLVGYVAAFGALLITYRLVRPFRMRRRPWVVTENVDQGASTRTLRVRPEGHPGFVFDPGQFAWLITGTSPFSLEQHPLSIASSAERPPDGSIEFAVKALGDWSRVVVPRLAPGTRVWVEGAFGAFTTEGKSAQGFVLVAGGIGIAPMRSMLLTMRDREDRRHVILVYAAHDKTRAPFRQELEQLREHLNLELAYVFEAPSADSGGHRGHVTKAVLEQCLPGQFRRYHYFVCGPPPMMDAVEGMLVDMGIARGSIDSERFNVV
jgi:predicted ferric reductase